MYVCAEIGKGERKKVVTDPKTKKNCGVGFVVVGLTPFNSIAFVFFAFLQ